MAIIRAQAATSETRNSFISIVSFRWFAKHQSIPPRLWLSTHVLLRHRLLRQPGGFACSGSRRLAADDVVDVEHLRLAWLYPDVGQNRHQTLAKRFELLPRVIDLANAKVALRAEADVVIHPVRGKGAGLLQATDTLVVLLGRQRRRGEVGNDAHRRSSLAWGRPDSRGWDVLPRHRLLPQ